MPCVRVYVWIFGYALLCCAVCIMIVSFVLSVLIMNWQRDWRNKTHSNNNETQIENNRELYWSTARKQTLAMTLKILKKVNLMWMCECMRPIVSVCFFFLSFLNSPIWCAYFSHHFVSCGINWRFYAVWVLFHYSFEIHHMKLTLHDFGPSFFQNCFHWKRKTHRHRHTLTYTPIDSITFTTIWVTWCYEQSSR